MTQGRPQSATPAAAAAAGPLHWRGLQGLGLLLRRFNAAEGAFSPAFNRRRMRMLTLGGALVFLSSIPWAAYFAARERWGAALLEFVFIAAGAGVLLLVKRRLLRIAGLLTCSSLIVLVVMLALTVDVNTAAVPRTTQLYLIPLTVMAFFLLQNEVALLRIGMPMASLAAFVVLTVSTSGFGFAPVMDDDARRGAVLIVALVAAVALYAALYAMLREARESTSLEQAFAVAIAAGDIETYLQPQCTADGRIIGAEALMRWRHPERGFISPAEFIPMAERSGLIVPAGERILADVCTLLQRWADDPAMAALGIAVNVSPAQLFSGDSAQRLLARVPESVSARGVLKFELTEGVFVQDIERVRERLAQIRARGIRLALDDFGTGFSSLNYLHQLPLDQLKVDQSFVARLGDDANARAIANMIVQLGLELGLEVIAEGTETPAQVKALQDMGCRHFQGYLFSRPLPVGEFEVLARVLHAERRGLRVAA